MPVHEQVKQTPKRMLLRTCMLGHAVEPARLELEQSLPLLVMMHERMYKGWVRVKTGSGQSHLDTCGHGRSDTIDAASAGHLTT